MSAPAWPEPAAIVLTTFLLATSLALILILAGYRRRIAVLNADRPQHDEPRRITARDAIAGTFPIPITNDRTETRRHASAFMETLSNHARQARARRILKRAFKSGASCIQPADPKQYAVTAIVRSDGVLELWLMSITWKTITITSRFRRVHMVHDNQGHLAAAVPARELAETVAIMAGAND